MGRSRKQSNASKASGTRASDAATAKAWAEAAKTGAAQASRRLWWVVLAVAGLSLIHFTLATTSVLHKSNTYDELAHLMRGYCYRLTGDYRVGPPHPPLAHYWASLPVSPSRVKFPSRNQKAWRTSDMWTLGRQFYYYKNLGNAQIIDTMLFRGRAMIALWSTALGILVFVWSRKLFGTVGGLLSMTLYAFSPTMLAHGRLVTTDCAAALFFMCSLASIWWLLHRVSPLSVVASAAALTGLFLAKMSAVLIIPVGIVLLVVRLASRRPLPAKLGRREWLLANRDARLACLLGIMFVWIAVVWTGIWGAYGFRYRAMTGAITSQDRFYTSGKLPKGKDVWDYESRGLNHLPPIIEWLRAHEVLPEAYLYCAITSAQTARGRNSFLNGEVNILGFRTFFPYTFAVKTPLPLLGLLAAACVALASGSTLVAARSAPPAPPAPPDRPDSPHPSLVYELAPLGIFFVAYWLVTLQSHLNIGQRHLLPTYPVLFIVAGAAATFLRSQARWVKVPTLALVVLYVGASLATFPNYLTYFNILAGGPNQAYRHLVDSNLDWGQDLPSLKTYFDQRQNDGFSGETYVSYFGSGGSLALKHFGIEAKSIPASLSNNATGTFALGPGLYAISATNLQQVYLNPGKHRWDDELEQWYQKMKPMMETFLATENSSKARKRYANSRFQRAFRQYQKLVFARLCEYLRSHKPDDNINHSILIYELDANMLHQALQESLSHEIKPLD